MFVSPFLSVFCLSYHFDCFHCTLFASVLTFVALHLPKNKSACRGLGWRAGRWLLLPFLSLFGSCFRSTNLALYLPWNRSAWRGPVWRAGRWLLASPHSPIWSGSPPSSSAAWRPSWASGGSKEVTAGLGG
jgi:hypothetical protein